jgi:hypothetical protein
VRAPTGTTQPTGPVARAVAGADTALGGLSNGVLRLEDAALVTWLLVGPPLARLLGGSSTSPTALGGDQDPVTGLIYVVATVLAVAVIATRSPGDPVLGFEGISTARSYAPFPFLLSLAIVGQTGLDRLGIASDAVIGIVFLITMACYVAWPHLPSLPRTTRRLMILPFILVAGTVFGGMIADLSSLFDYRALLGDPNASPSAFLGLLGLQVLFSVFFYLAFIFAPRMVAEAEGSWLAWLARYALFLLVTIVSVTFLGAGAG